MIAAIVYSHEPGCLASEPLPASRRRT